MPLLKILHIMIVLIVLFHQVSSSWSVFRISRLPTFKMTNLQRGNSKSKNSPVITLSISSFQFRRPRKKLAYRELKLLQVVSLIRISIKFITINRRQVLTSVTFLIEVSLVIKICRTFSGPEIRSLRRLSDQVHAAVPLDPKPEIHTTSMEADRRKTPSHWQC